MKTFLKLYDLLVTGLAAVAGSMLLVVFVFVVDDVVQRNLLISPPAWSVPLTEYALLYSTMLAAPWLVRTKGHILVEILRQRLPPSAARVLEFIVYLVCIAICIVLTWNSVDLWIEAWQSGEEDARAIVIPRTYLYGPVVTGFFLMGCEFLRFLIGPDSLYHHTPDDQGSV